MEFVIKPQDVPVSLPANLTEEQLLSFQPFKNWHKKLTEGLDRQNTDASHPFHKAPYKLQRITVESATWFGKEKLGFIKILCDVRSVDDWIPGSVFLRGPSVAMLVILVPDDVDLEDNSIGERYVLLTVQPRIASGSLEFVELPAGMVDDGSFAGAAAKEIREELGLEIPESQLTNLTELAIPGDPKTGDQEHLPRAMFPSVGGCDEYIPIFLHERRVSRDQLKGWTGKLTGVREEGEKITLKLIRLQDLWKEGARDAKALAAWALWDGLKKEGKI